MCDACPRVTRVVCRRTGASVGYGYRITLDDDATREVAVLVAVVVAVAVVVVTRMEALWGVMHSVRSRLHSMDVDVPI